MSVESSSLTKRFANTDLGFLRTFLLQPLFVPHVKPPPLRTLRPCEDTLTSDNRLTGELETGLGVPFTWEERK